MAQLAGELSRIMRHDSAQAKRSQAVHHGRSARANRSQLQRCSCPRSRTHCVGILRQPRPLLDRRHLASWYAVCLDSFASAGIWYARLPCDRMALGCRRRMNDAVQSAGGRGGAARSIRAPGGARRRRFRADACCRQDEVAAVKALLGDAAARARAADRVSAPDPGPGGLPARGPPACAGRGARIPMAEVYEVATFYAHFDVVADGEARPPKVTIRVCDSLSCMLAGAEKLLATLQAEKTAGRAGRARALHRLLRYRAGGRGRPSPCRPCQRRQAQGARAARRRAPADAGLPGLRRLREGRRLRRAALVPLGRSARSRT